MRNKAIRFAFFGSIFLGVYIFFAVAHPFYIFDADDWRVISERRWGIPLWGYWVPSRILPANLMSLTGDFATWVLRPFIKDYLLSITCAWAGLLALLIMLYIHGVSQVLTQKIKIKGVTNYFLSFFFLLMHFLIFKKQAENNIYAFYSKSVDLYYSYTIPALFNEIIVLYLIRNDWKSLSNVKKGMLVLVAYLGVFSNPFHSIILVSYASFYIFEVIIRCLKREGGFIEGLWNNLFYLYIITLWIIQCVYEFFGGRADELKSSFHFIKSVEAFWGWTKKINLFFYILLASTLIVFLVCVFRLKRKEKQEMDFEFKRLLHICLWSGVIVAGFLIAMCSIGPVGYLQSVDVFNSFLFYLLFGFILIIAYLIKTYEKLFIFVPLITFVSLTVTINGLKLFADSNIHNLRGKECLPISKDLVNQVLEKADGGYDTVTLHVPVWEGNDGNWPHDVNCLGQRMANTLYRHGMTDRLMKIDIFPDPDYKPSANTEAYDKRKK